VGAQFESTASQELDELGSQKDPLFLQEAEQVVCHGFGIPEPTISTKHRFVDTDARPGVSAAIEDLRPQTDPECHFLKVRGPLVRPRFDEVQTARVRPDAQRGVPFRVTFDASPHARVVVQVTKRPPDRLAVRVWVPTAIDLSVVPIQPGRGHE